MIFNWKKCYISFVNLDSRQDRLVRMEQTLNKAGINAVRTRGILPDEYTGTKESVTLMNKGTRGAIGCMYSQIAIMKEALKQKVGAIILEDDLDICIDIQLRLDYIEKFINAHPTDVFWLGATFHKEPVWHKAGHPNKGIQGKCDCAYNADWLPTDDERIVRTLGCWSTYAYIIPYESLEKIIKLLEENSYRTIGIDHCFIMLQPQLNTYSFIAGCIKQYDNDSNISHGKTYFSQFHKLGKHWYSDRVEQFNPKEFYNGNK